MRRENSRSSSKYSLDPPIFIAAKVYRSPGHRALVESEGGRVNDNILCRSTTSRKLLSYCFLTSHGVSGPAYKFKSIRELRRR
jgi:hypothetical protein